MQLLVDTSHHFNPRLREGGDHKYCEGCIFDMDFNPRLREGGDGISKYQEWLTKISIHASAKEATGLSIAFLYQLMYFNPRLREGGDGFPHAIKFSFRISIHASAKEATIKAYRLVDNKLNISIHASAKEATCHHLCRIYYQTNFNPRLREGGDSNIL